MSTTPGIKIAVAETAADIGRCYETMNELRPHLRGEDEFIAQVQRQQAEGYRVAFIEESGEIRAVAGYRLTENLFAGRILYVDDLVTREVERSKGYGEKLFDWLVAEARAGKCTALELDSNVQRFGAHRFYLRKRMDIEAHHFRLRL